MRQSRFIASELEMNVQSQYAYLNAPEMMLDNYIKLLL